MNDIKDAKKQLNDIQSSNNSKELIDAIKDVIMEDSVNKIKLEIKELCDSNLDLAMYQARIDNLLDHSPNRLQTLLFLMQENLDGILRIAKEVS